MINRDNQFLDNKYISPGTIEDAQVAVYKILK